ncbi:MAG: hypothetical protein K2P93_07710 [Alphaproteobacteria bacterium]|nr:hypothetical protein [Alphaproteobacteria bacterium]
MQFKWSIFFLIFGLIQLEPGIAYDEEEDYKNHQAASRLFFGKEPQNPVAQTILNKFLTEYNSASPISPIKLDELCPRSRILLLRSIAQTIFEKSKHNEKIEAPWSKVVVSYSFGNAQCVVRYSPTGTDPGNLTIDKLDYKTLWNGLNNHQNKERSKEIANIFFNGYKQLIPCKQAHLNKAILFFDFEIARNLVGDNLDDGNRIIPIASAIINFLELAKENSTYQISQLFEEVEMEEIILEEKDFEKYSHESAAEWEEEVSVEWKYMGYNPFGSDSLMRVLATKRILTESDKVKEERAKPEVISDTLDEILTQYYKFFGGSHED